MNEQHSLSSLAARCGVTRTAARGAILSGRLNTKATRIGAREIFTIQSKDIQAYKDSVFQKLEARINRITTDPVRRKEALGSALASIRDEAKTDLDEWTVDRLMDLIGIGREAASYLLGKYAKRKIQGGWEVSADALAKIKRHAEETRGRGVIK